MLIMVQKNCRFGVVVAICGVLAILAFADNSTSGLTHQAPLPQTVTILHDGCESVVPYSPGSVAQAVLRSGIAVGPDDIVKPSLDSQGAAGERIVIIRVKRVRVTVEEELQPPHTVRQSSRMPPRLASIASRGKPGRIERTYDVTCHDGEVVRETLVSENLLQEAVPTIVAIGGRTLPSRGYYSGMRAFEMEASAYSAQQKGIKDTTAGGYKTGKGVVAVDPQFIPLKTHLYIEGYGEAIAGDTGGAIKGNRIDLGFDTLREAINFGRRKVQVYVLD
jgi:3D (Asp-Asp-Asp) domain-containing protein